MDIKRIAIIGTHCSGKTTICHELSSVFRKKNINIGVCEEVARKSWFVGRKIVQPESEVELLGMQVTEEMRAILNYDVVLCDRSVIDIVVYSRVFFSDKSNPKDLSMLKSIEAFTQSYVQTYDIIFKTTNHYDPLLTADKLRPIEPLQQQ
jgi:nicotinamide riboside kinase